MDTDVDVDVDMDTDVDVDVDMDTRCSHAIHQEEGRGPNLEPVLRLKVEEPRTSVSPAKKTDSPQKAQFRLYCIRCRCKGQPGRMRIMYVWMLLDPSAWVPAVLDESHLRWRLAGRCSGSGH